MAQVDIQVPGMGYIGSEYFEIKQKEKEESAPLKELPLEILVQ